MSDIPLLKDFGTLPATPDETQAAWEKGRAAGADFVIMAREIDDDGTVDDQLMFVFSPPGHKLRPTFEDMAAKGLATRCQPPTREERRRAKGGRDR